MHLATLQRYCTRIYDEMLGRTSGQNRTYEYSPPLPIIAPFSALVAVFSVLASAFIHKAVFNNVKRMRNPVNTSSDVCSVARRSASHNTTDLSFRAGFWVVQSEQLSYARPHTIRNLDLTSLGLGRVLYAVQHKTLVAPTYYWNTANIYRHKFLSSKSTSSCEMLSYIMIQYKDEWGTSAHNAQYTCICASSNAASRGSYAGM